MNIHILISINRKVSRSVVGVLLSVLNGKGGGSDYLNIHSLYVYISYFRSILYGY